MSPKISIIIATKNAAEGIGSCIDSIINQTYRSYEILIQDALSVDRTLAIVRGYDPDTVKVRTEPDAGIYDAWNRALARAGGEWIMFLGADDRLTHATVLDRRTQILAGDASEVDLVCGRIAFIGQKGRPQKQTGASWNWPDMLKYQIVAHIGFMHHRRLFGKFGFFSTQYRISGDYEFLLPLGAQMNAIFVDDVEVLAGAQGLSQREVGRALIENFRTQRPEKISGMLWRQET
jgi:glycosyltransferase involved in cell wall biosynthesis